MQDILREARGCRLCGLDRTVWIFVLAHGGGLALLLCTDTDLSLRVSGAPRRPPLPAQQMHFTRETLRLLEDTVYVVCHRPLLCFGDVNAW